MGISASQGRLLSLTAKKADVEFQGQMINQRRMDLAKSAAKAVISYNQVLSRADSATSFGSTSISNASVAGLTAYNSSSTSANQRFIKDSTGKLIVSDAVYSSFTKATRWGGTTYTNTTYNAYKSMSLDQIKVDGVFVEFVSNNEQTTGTLVLPRYTGTNDADRWATYCDYTSKLSDEKMAYYQNLFCELKKSGGCVAPGDDNLSSSDWLTQQIGSGNATLYEMSPGTIQTVRAESFSAVSWDSVGVSEGAAKNTVEAERATVEYNATMAIVQAEDKKLELMLKQLDTEQQEIQTELEAVNKVIDKNVESSFKTFG